MKIAVDIDGPLAKLHEKYKEFCMEKYGEYVHGIDDNRLEEFHILHTDDIGVEDGAIDGIAELHKHHDLHIISARPSFIVDRTIKWLDRYFPQKFKTFNFTNFNRNGNKYDACKKLECSILIEDDIKLFLRDFKDDILVLLYTKPWNIEEVLKRNMIRVNGWKNITELFSNGLTHLNYQKV